MSNITIGGIVKIKIYKNKLYKIVELIQEGDEDGK
jgi:hypothetical protein